jgi:hypothetical protein
MARDPHYTPFKGRQASTPAMRTLHRFSKPGHTAEIRERTVAAFRALEYFVFVDGELIESQMFPGERASNYLPELEARVTQFVVGGWIPDAGSPLMKPEG